MLELGLQWCLGLLCVLLTRMSELREVAYICQSALHGSETCLHLYFRLQNPNSVKIRVSYNISKSKYSEIKEQKNKKGRCFTSQKAK